MCFYQAAESSTCPTYNADMHAYSCCTWCSCARLNRGPQQGLGAPSVKGLDVGVSGSSSLQSSLPDGSHNIPMVHKQLAQKGSPLLNDPLQQHAYEMWYVTK